MTELPVVSSETLTACTPAELIELIIEHADRTPRNVIDECAQRGEQILPVLAPFAQANDLLENETPGHWWLRFHMVMILGLIPGETAGLLLVEFIRGMCREEDENHQDWLAGYWPALMRNKPPSVIALVRDISVDKEIDWYMRTNMMAAVLNDAYQQGGPTLEGVLDWAAGFITNEAEDWDFRCSTANDLLNYPRDHHRPLVEALTSEKHGLAAFFSEKDINQAYARGTDGPDSDTFSDPWKFYNSEEIEKRQQRWQEEDRLQQEYWLEESDSDRDDVDDSPKTDFNDASVHEPFQREMPKVGRNEPCPCGSGKKYKKCCLGLVEE